MPARRTVAKKRGKSKIKIIDKRKVTQKMLEQMNVADGDLEISLIQALIPLGLKAVDDALQEEVKRLVGNRYEHGKENVRWGRQSGSVYLRDQKLPIEVPRVRNQKHNIEIPLAAYQKLQTPHLDDKQTVLKLLNGISTRKYAKSAELVPEVFGISPSSLSKRFKKNTSEIVRKLKTRSLSAYDFTCIFIDGKRYAKDGLLVILGVTLDGKKVILDIEHSHSENSAVVEQLFEKLIERGLKFEEGILFIVDGSKGLIRGIQNKFQEYAFIQRCQWHKRENVLSYLDEANQQIYKRRLHDAYKKTTYREAKAELDRLIKELTEVNQSAGNSLREGLAETLTLHELGLSSELCKSLQTTNCIESIMSQLGQYTDKVDRWRNSYQLLRWTCASLLEIEPNLNRIHGHRYLNVLRFKMKEAIKKRKEKKYGRQSDQLFEVLAV